MKLRLKWPKCQVYWNLLVLVLMMIKLVKRLSFLLLRKKGSEDASITEEDVISFCRQGLTAYKAPKHVVFIDEIPKSSVGKLLRRELR